jgi:hypothetical protein
VRDRASLINVLNENQRMQQKRKFQEIYIFTIVASAGFHLIHRFELLLPSNSIKQLFF